MEDLLLMQILKKKGIITDSDIHEFHELTLSSLGDDVYYAKVEDTASEHIKNHISETEAKSIVSKMYHCYGGKKYIGEKYDINISKDIHKKYKDILDEDITCIDIYLAINSQYHNYYELFKSWFSTGIDTKIIESAIVYWFKDDDYKGHKICDYFKS